MAAGDPIGADLCSGTTSGNTLPNLGTAWEEREITIDTPVELTSGVKYAIVVRGAAGDSYWVSKNNVYANGISLYSDDSGATWAEDGTLDTWFKTKAGAAEKDTNTFAETSSWGYDITDTDWNAQSFQASSTYTISSIILKLCKFPATTPGTITVSIKAVSAVGSKAVNPTPTDSATDVTLDQALLTWDDGGDTDEFLIYYGTESGNLSLIAYGPFEFLSIVGITDGSPYDYITTRYWRIDSVNDAGTVTGDEWSFTTIRLGPPGVTYFYPTGGYYYKLLVDTNGDYGNSPADGGVEDTDYEVVTYEPNFIRTNRKLVAIAENRLWYEDI